MRVRGVPAHDRRVSEMVDRPALQQANPRLDCRPERTLVRDGPQRQLTAKQGEFGTGTIPLAAFAGKPVMVPGGTGSIDTHERRPRNRRRARRRVDGDVQIVRAGLGEDAVRKSIDWIWVDERCSRGNLFAN